ncbi:MAG: hypothetical protein HY746_02710 [Elusimicrobia bacterium]|nr:hypothetical protein [Elusimicrobiota bacterium]
MKKIILSFFITFVLHASDSMALENIPSEFESFRIYPHTNQVGVGVYLKAGKKYTGLSTQAKAQIIEKAYNAVVPDKSKNIIAVELNGEGEVWILENSKALKIDFWSDKTMYLSKPTRKTGRWFGYLGGQIMSGGDFPARGWTARIGTTLLKNKYDAALSLSRNAFADIEDSGITSIGLTCRRLFQYTEHAGLNIGVQADYARSESASETTPLISGGINIYLPGGSFDVTMTFGEQGRSSLMLGYTIFINRQ